MNRKTPAAFIMNAQRLIAEFIRNYELCEQLCVTQYNVTVSQGSTLLALPQEGNLSMNELSQVMGLASSTMTRMVDQLVAKGLVSRTPDPEDRRIVRVGLTAQGQQLRSDLEKAYKDFFQITLGEIPEEELHGILRALDQINKAYEKAMKSFCTG